MSKPHSVKTNAFSETTSVGQMDETDSDILDQALQRLADGDRNSDDILGLREIVSKRVQLNLGSRRCDLWSFLRDQCGYDDTQIRDHLWDHLPLSDRKLLPSSGPTLLHEYTELITAALLRQNGQQCGCADRYADNHDSGNGERYKKFTGMKESCQANHWIRSYSTLPGSDQRRTVKLPEQWVWKAVDGNTVLHINKSEGIYRDLGNSMLVAVLTTPAGTGLYLIKTTDKEGKEVERLVDSRSIEQGDWLVPGGHEDDDCGSFVESSGNHQAAVNAYVFFCEHCQKVVGENGNTCRTPNCNWVLKTTINSPQSTYEAMVSTCGQHYWPKSGIDCPVCNRPARRGGRKRVPAAYAQLTE